MVGIQPNTNMLFSLPFPLMVNWSRLLTVYTNRKFRKFRGCIISHHWNLRTRNARLFGTSSCSCNYTLCYVYIVLHVLLMKTYHSEKSTVFVRSLTTPKSSDLASWVGSSVTWFLPTDCLYSATYELWREFNGGVTAFDINFSRGCVTVQFSSSDLSKVDGLGLFLTGGIVSN